jgi:hypothetical protein
MVPTPLGRLLTAYLTIHFPEYVDVNFTAKVEEQLDEVSGQHTRVLQAGECRLGICVSEASKTLETRDSESESGISNEKLYCVVRMRLANSRMLICSCDVTCHAVCACCVGVLPARLQLVAWRGRN